MTRRAILRAEDIKQRIGYIRELAQGRTFEEIYADRIASAALERFFEIVSEASRHLPADWKATYGADIPWQKVADLGNILRHVYHRADYEALWSIYENDLDSLEAAIDAMLAANPS